MWNKIKQFFKSSNTTLEIVPKTLETLDTLDDVIVKIDDEILHGWVWEINKKCIYVLLSNLDIITIHYKRPLNQSVIKDKNIILYLNEYENSNTRSSY